MIRSIRFSTILLCLSLVSAFIVASAQTPPETPSDRKAFTDATYIKDPAKKIEELEKFIKDFPKSYMIYNAHQTIFETLVKNYPEQKEKIREQVDKAIEKVPEYSKPYLYDPLAAGLVEVGMMLDKA